LRAVERSRHDWQRSEIEALAEEFARRTLATLGTFCRAVVSRDHETSPALKNADRSVLAETTALAEVFVEEEQVLLGYATRKLGVVDLRAGVDPRVGRWDPYRPSEVFTADLQLIELAIEEVAEQLRGTLPP